MYSATPREGKLLHFRVDALVTKYRETRMRSFLVALLMLASGAAMATPLAPSTIPRLEGVQRLSEGLGGLSLTCQRCSPESVIGPALHYAGLLGHPPSRWGRAPGVHMMNGGFTCVSSIPRRNERLG